MSNKEDAKERVEAINAIANNMGDVILTLTRGDWDMAASVALVLFSSIVAQAALQHDENVEQVFEEFGEPARRTTLAIYAALKAETEDDQDEQRF